MNIYGISQGAQSKQLEKLCFEKCGQIRIGVINFCGGYFYPCLEDTCEYEEKRLDVETEIDDRNLIIRKLKEV